MRILKNAVASAIAILAIYVGLGSLFKTEMYDLAMEMEAGLSGLEKQRTSISIGDIEYYENEQAGQKPTVLLVHGFAAYKENWVRFARPFKDDFHVIALDLPGHGKSTQSIDLHYTIVNQAAWINEFMEKLGIEKFHMAGNSMGGAITAQFSATYPDKILSATLVDPAGLSDHRPILMDYLERGENPLIVDTHEDFLALMDFALEQKPFVPWPLTEVSAQRASKMKTLHEKLWQDFQGFKGGEFKLVLESIEAPTLILWGKQDRVINYLNAEIFAKHIRNSKVHLWDDVGHAPMVEIPKHSAAVMIDHIRIGAAVAVSE